MDVGRQVGSKIEQKSTEKGIEKVMKKEGHHNGKKGAVRPRDVLRSNAAPALSGSLCPQGSPLSKNTSIQDTRNG